MLLVVAQLTFYVAKLRIELILLLLLGSLQAFVSGFRHKKGPLSLFSSEALRKPNSKTRREATLGRDPTTNHSSLEISQVSDE
jgi:hypothetical protein